MARPDDPTETLSQVNVRLPTADGEALRGIADEAGASLTALLGAIVHQFLLDHEDERVPESVLRHARRIDAQRRRRPHLRATRRRR